MLINKVRFCAKLMFGCLRLNRSYESSAALNTCFLQLQMLSYFCWIYRRRRVHSEVALTLHLFNLVIFICVRSSIFSTHLQVISWTHLNISHLHLVLLILPVSLLLSPPLFSSYLPFLIFPSIFILNTPPLTFSPSIPLSLSLCPLSSLFLSAVLWWITFPSQWTQPIILGKQ